ncbi:MAG TPA: Crp/Fnr family transcriptional regulator [Bacteroidia bacterium]|jgi:CRP/FNR family transcriptional regulator|nr:Crp/Fnr family transcriptional regulator [Bacteroidia bacterium]
MHFLEVLTEEERALFNKTVSEKTLSRNETLFTEGKKPSAVHLLKQGKIKLFTTDQQGRERIIHLARPGDLMGYRAALGNDTYSCSATALEDAVVYALPIDTFLLLLDRNATLSHSVIRLLTAELRHAEHHLGGSARKTVKARLAEAMLLIADTYGFEADGATLDLSLSREELAAMVGTATETTIRILKSMEEEGLVATNGRKIRLPDMDALRRSSEMA